jgi:signal transduction histidine kinase
MKNGEEKLKKERKPHGAWFWLIWVLVTGAVLGCCIGVVEELQSGYGLYTNRSGYYTRWNRNQLHTYAVYALSDHKDDFRLKELQDTNFRYAVYVAEDPENVDLTDRSAYAVCTLSEEMLENIEDLYTYSATLGEHTEIEYSIDNLWGQYGYVVNRDGAYIDGEYVVDEGKDYYVLCTVADPINWSSDDLVSQGVKLANTIYDLRYVPIGVGVVAGIFFLICCIAFLKAFFRFLGRCWKGLAFQWRGNVPLFWRLVLICGAVLLLELFIVILGAESAGEELIIFSWGIQSLLVAALVIFVGLQIRRLTDGAKRLAAGDLTSKVDTRHMVYDLRVIGESLNTTGEGMEKAVADRMKSEHFKTELISNVSHDIKTPLTSIISYVELLKEQPAEEPANREYLETLERQSVRLKKLLEDLIEASKASTGNLKADLQPCDVNMVLSQILGEYEEKLSEKELDLRIKLPEERVSILADTQHLQRVLDNLLVNIAKYAQPGTRAYVNLEATESEARIELKNTSREPLNLTSAELLERFTRGDSSRGSEGNGLGLSIAQSLTELMNGTMELVVDGDLFKVILRFPRVASEAN